ncbi:hypothetical protein ABZ543_37400, partial [Streptomyces roseifaciens]
FQPYQIRFPFPPPLKEAVGPNSVSGPLLERGFAFQLSLSGGDPDFIRRFPAEANRLFASDKGSRCSG